MTGDRQVFEYLRRHGLGNGTGQATSYYQMNAYDGMNAKRRRWIADKGVKF